MQLTIYYAFISIGYRNKICPNEYYAAHIRYWKNMLRNVTVENRGVHFTLLPSLLYKYWKNIFYDWKMALYFLSIYLRSLLQLSNFVTFWQVRIPIFFESQEREKVILLMGILMVAMTVSNSGVAIYPADWKYISDSTIYYTLPWIH